MYPASGQQVATSIDISMDISMDRSMHISMDISMDMGPGPGRAHALSEEGCQGPGRVPGPAGPGPTRQPSSLSTWARPGPGPISMDMSMDICMDQSMDISMHISMDTSTC